MCGFAGTINLNGLDTNINLEKKMQNALDRLYPRGPDQQGKWVDDKSYFVHSRLSIIDTSEGGKQPMKKYNRVLVYNGEIYNFKELRKKLIDSGYIFSSSSDCEVLIAGWDKWGDKFLNYINGMYAFAIWDINLQKLTLVRDPYGKKPLLYMVKKKEISFASDLKSLEKIISCGDINTEAVDSLFRFRFIRDPLTIYNNVNKLPAGHIIEFDYKGFKIRKWYTLPIKIFSNSNKQELYPKITELFDKAVNKRLVSDVPLGVLLSGGMDSSVILASLASQGKKLPCFTMGFEGASDYYEERPAAKKIANYYGMHHSNLEISSKKLLKIIPEVFNASDEPFADSSALPFYALSQEVSKNINVVLSGDGGDEVFGGYRKYLGEKWADIGSYIPEYIRKNLAAILIENKDTSYGELSRRIRRYLNNIDKDGVTRHINWLEQMNQDEIKSLFGYEASNVRSVFMDSRRDLNDSINAILLGDMQISLVGDMLVKLDRMSMANSLEVRSPFLDKELVEFAFSIPGNYKVGHFQGKKILREAFSNRLPKWLMKLPKKGFEVPLANWLRGELKTMLEHACLPKNLDRIGIINHSLVNNWKDSLFSGKRDTSWKLWTLMSYFYWVESKGLA